MNSRERIGLVLSGDVPDRVPIHDHYWQSTLHRWWNEGLPQGVSPHDYFQTEFVRVGGNNTMQFPVRVIEDSDRARIYWDSNGVLREDLRLTDGWTAPLDFTIKSRDDWLEHRYRMRFNDSRIPKSVLEKYYQARERDKCVAYYGDGCFHATWQKVGFENQLMLMLDDPGFINDLFAAHTQLTIDIYEEMQRLGLEFDAAWFGDDLGSNKAPLISPAMYRELVFPHHKRMCDYFAEQGLKSILHSDGNVGPLIPHFLDAGFGALHPLEVKVGLDVRELKRQYGDRLILIGNIDVRKLSGTREEVEEEIASKIPVAMAGGGYIYHSDHSVPPTVSFENYCFAIEMVKRYGTYE